MNAQNAKDYLPLVKAMADGKTIQKGSEAFGWSDSESLALDGPPNYYRVKPEPREWWVNVYRDSLDCYPTRQKADQCALQSRAECIRVREVI